MYILVLAYLIFVVKPIPKNTTSLNSQKMTPAVSMVITDCSTSLQQHSSQDTDASYEANNANPDEPKHR